MSETNTNLLKEKYLKVKELLRMKNPDTDPYKSNYEAKDILCEMKTILEENSTTENESELRQNSRIAGIYYLIGTVFMATEENKSVEEHLLKCYGMIKDNACHPDNILCAIACLNQLGLLFAHTLRNEDALNYLDKAALIYKTFTSYPNHEEPLSFITMFTGALPKEDKSGSIILEKTHTLTLYFLAQVHTALENKEKAALYCHETLKRQIESKDFEHIDWAVNAATMSQVLIEKNAFKEARHHLAAAMYVIDKYEETLDNDETLGEEEICDAKKEELTRRRSDLLRCWIKYCIVLLSYSKERLMRDEDQPEYEVPPELKGLQFPTLSEHLKEDVVTCLPLLTFEDARPVFLFGQQCCNQATNYYSLTEHASDYSVISMDHSQLYVHLSFFEGNEDRQCKMLKRRLDLLTNIVKNLNPNFYLDVCREVWLSLGQICSEMVELKIKKARLSGDSSTHLVSKVNSLIEEGVTYYTSFIKSFMERRTNKMPSNYPKEHEQTIILSNLHAARLYSKYLGADKVKSMEIDKKSLEFYETIVHYARTHKDIAKCMAPEVQVAGDMLILLPYKLTRLAESHN